MFNESSPEANFTPSDYPADFKFFAKIELLLIKSPEEKGFELSVGPKFNLSGHRTGDIEVHSLVLESNKTIKQEFRRQLKKIILFGYQHNRLVGIRHLDLEYFEADKGKINAIARSDVNIAFRNQGLLRPIESVTLFMLQNEANAISGELVWEIENDNASVLKAMKNDPKSSSKQIAEKEAEQQRWKNFYSFENIGAIPSINNRPELDEYEVMFKKEGESLDLRVVRAVNGLKFRDQSEVSIEYRTDGDSKIKELEKIINSVENVVN